MLTVMLVSTEECQVEMRNSLIVYASKDMVEVFCDIVRSLH